MALKPSTVRRLNEADSSYRAAWQEREDAIVAAWVDNKPNCSVREIAEAVGLTHTGVSQVLSRRGVRKIGKIDWDAPDR